MLCTGTIAHAVGTPSQYASTNLGGEGIGRTGRAPDLRAASPQMAITPADARIPSSTCSPESSTPTTALADDGAIARSSADRNRGEICEAAQP